MLGTARELPYWLTVDVICEQVGLVWFFLGGPGCELTEVEAHDQRRADGADPERIDFGVQEILD